MPHVRHCTEVGPGSLAFRADGERCFQPLSCHIRYREGRSTGLFPCRFLLGKSHWEGLVSPSFLRALDSPRITYSRRLCKTRKPQQKGLLLTFPTMSRRTIQCLYRSASLPGGIDSLYWPKRTLCLQSPEQV